MKQGAAALLAAGIIALAACGGGATAPSTTAEAPPTTAPTTTTPPATTPTTTTPDPAELGDQISDLYLASYDDLIALLADRPDAETAAAELATLKEQYVQALVALGHRREALDAAGRAAVDARIAAALNRLPTATYDAYQEAYTYYSPDFEVANLISSFNIIGQYANFDLLRQQAPDEAARLGIE